MEEIIFPNQIRMFRRMRGKPMKSLAAMLGVSVSAISKIEKGYRRIDEAQLDKISQYLNCPKEAVFVSEHFSQPEVIKAWKKEQERRSKINAGSGLKTLGAGLRYIRGQKQLTLQDVAKGAKMTLSVYHRIEMGQREVDEKNFAAIARALGTSETDLQMKIYELDMSGALEELKQSTDSKNGVFISKGGYNDLPVSRFMIRTADSAERAIGILGLPQVDGSILADPEHSAGSVMCPSTLSADKSVYALSMMSDVLGDLIPRRSVLLISKNAGVRAGDIGVFDLGNNRLLPVQVKENNRKELIALAPKTGKEYMLTKDNFTKCHRVMMIVMP